jgi:tetratricopeptide (TPR) repeat protein
LRRFWQVRGYLTEGRGALEALLAQAGHGSTQQPAQSAVPASVRAKALYGAAVLAYSQGDYRQAVVLHQESLALRRELGDERDLAASLNSLALAMQQVGDLAAAATLHEESLALRRTLGDRLGLADSLNNLGNVALEQGDYGQATTLYEESLAVCRELGDKRLMAVVLNSLGNVAGKMDDYARAAELFRESLALGRELGEKRLIAIVLVNLGNSAQAQGDRAQAMTQYAESLTLCQTIGLPWLVAHGLEGMAGALGVTEPDGQPERAAQLFGAAAALRETTGASLEAAELARHDGSVAALRLALGEDAFTAAWEAGRTMPPEQAIAEATRTGSRQARPFA